MSTTSGRSSTSATFKVIAPLRDFLRTSAASGVVLVVATVVALFWANSPFKSSYLTFWDYRAGLSIGSGAGLSLSLREWVNDGLMTLFFFVVGLEIKRELVEGELNTVRRALLPGVAALGGMLAPALIYVAINQAGTGDGASGWGIPMATDIAMAVGVLALLGSRVAPGAKLFLLAVAIVDDIGAIVVIALFYGGGLDGRFAVAAAAALALVVIARRVGVNSIGAYVVVGVVLWYVTKKSGVHATIAGVALGLLAPAKPSVSADLIDEAVLVDVGGLAAVEETVRMARGSVSVIERLEHRLLPWTSFVIVPLFASANAGVPLDGNSLRSATSSRITIGIVLGLVIGKIVGISGATWLALRLGVAELPKGVRFSTVIGLSALAGIGFTVSLFVAELAFADQRIVEAKMGILIASLVAAALGSLLLVVIDLKYRRFS
jgi:Na+:H+ antiporter, NhaA family